MRDLQRDLEEKQVEITKTSGDLDEISDELKTVKKQLIQKEELCNQLQSIMNKVRKNRKTFT